ncbi:MAG: glycosyltransferase, partial [Spirochaetales bacterium]|nr:glycosyltransferase [Spirochaetales bacterium]
MPTGAQRPETAHPTNGCTDESWAPLGPEDLDQLRRALARLRVQGGPLWSHEQLLAALEDTPPKGGLPPGPRPGSALASFVDHVLELLLLPGTGAAMVLRPGIGRTCAVLLPETGENIRSLGEAELLSLYEQAFLSPDADTQKAMIRLDFLSLYDRGSRVGGVQQIGRGLEVLLQRSCKRAANAERTLLALLEAPARRGRSVLVDPAHFREPGSLAERVRMALAILDELPARASARDCAHRLGALGLRPGWGRAPAAIRESLERVAGLLEAPTPAKLKELLGRLPLVERVVIVSPHGWFGQEGVLGRPDTGGQIVYILDQVRGLEEALRTRLEEAGLQAEPRVVVLTRQIPESEGTSCGEAREPIRGTRAGMILRLPFLDERGRRMRRWISRFEVWPYLPGFAERAVGELRRELGGEPDLIIGNYSDGNLVAVLLAERFGCALCTIAHALEKTKYPQADLRWGQYEAQYHFSVQLLADLVAMNAADFVVASTYQEIAGDERSPGQYEAHGSFTLPGLYRVSGGTDPLLDKFNIVPPGVDERVFFPYTRSEARDSELRRKVEHLLFEAAGEEILGTLTEPGRRPLLTLARLDRTKNIAGLVEQFGACEPLRQRCNLVVIAGKVDAAGAADAEERAEIRRVHALIERYALADRIRWLGIHLSKDETGEVYRVVADRGGLFVQPALYEAFGLTVLEAMASGLPTFATRYGGPSEIIQDGVNGRLVDPKAETGISGPLLSFLDQLEERPGAWAQLSEAGIERIQERFTWGRYSRHLL